MFCRIRIVFIKVKGRFFGVWVFWCEIGEVFRSGREWLWLVRGDRKRCWCCLFMLVGN